MERSEISGLIVLIILFLIMVLVAKMFFGGEKLKTAIAERGEVTGMYTLILYGATNSNDMETLALLDKEGDRYTIEPYAPDYRFKTRKNIPAEEALEEAERFISWHSAYRSYQIRKIIDDRENVVGYELRPLYLPVTFGLADLLEVSYTVKQEKVSVSIQLTPAAERSVHQQGGSG